MCICLSIKRSQALCCLSFPLTSGVDFHVGHFQSSYPSAFLRSLPNCSNMLPDDTRMLLPSLNKISTIEQTISAIKQKLTKRGD